MTKKKESLEEKLCLKRENGWDRLGPKRKEIKGFIECYKAFLCHSKTVRRCVKIIEVMAGRAISFDKPGTDYLYFTDIDQAKPENRNLFVLNRGKNIALIVRGKAPLEKGVNIIVSHIDAPCLHLKQIPLTEEGASGLAILRTQYYGGIKKYQWVSRPLALYGTVIKKDGSLINISIGEDPLDPVFFIPDLLPHLSRKIQSGKKIKDAVPGEKMSVLAGSIPIKDKKVKERVKLQILQGLHKKYGLIEEDFISAEMVLVPADRPRDVGFDRSMLMAYSHDDRACAYASLKAILKMATAAERPDRTAIAFFFDKEETGSDGNTGAKSNFLEFVLEELGTKSLIKTLRNSQAISADVSAGVNPNWPEPHELTNAAKIGYGVVLGKFHGSGGKYSTSDANAEFVGKVRRIFNEEGITWQYGATGKVDEGGGGTIANYFALRGMEIIDVGVPVLSMHAPLEVISKVDLYETYRAYKAFFEKA